MEGLVARDVLREGEPIQRCFVVDWPCAEDRHGALGLAALYTGLSLLAGFAALFAGLFIMRTV